MPARIVEPLMNLAKDTLVVSSPSVVTRYQPAMRALGVVLIVFLIDAVSTVSAGVVTRTPSEPSCAAQATTCTTPEPTTVDTQPCRVPSSNVVSDAPNTATPLTVPEPDRSGVRTKSGVWFVPVRVPAPL